MLSNNKLLLVLIYFVDQNFVEKKNYKIINCKNYRCHVYVN